MVLARWLRWPLTVSRVPGRQLYTVAKLIQQLDRLPSERTVRRHTFTLELAWLLHEQQCDLVEAALPPGDQRARYGLSDSSPAWGFDWLWSQHTSVPGGTEFVKFLEDAHAFIAGMVQWHAAEHEDPRPAHAPSPWILHGQYRHPIASCG